jgi:ArsR family transcriptional regulator
MRAGDQVSTVSERAIDTSQVISALAGLKHDLRLTIYRSLVRAGAGGMTPGHISSALQIAPSTLSFHLKELTQSHLITAVHDGRSINYSVNRGTMTSVIAYLIENCC